MEDKVDWEARNRIIQAARRVVIKVGSGIVAARGVGLNIGRIECLAVEVERLRQQQRQVALVSSGAVASGLELLGIGSRVPSVTMKQVAAAVGQSRLMWSYEKAFQRLGLHVAQVLLTHEDFNHRQRFLNARNTMLALLEHPVVTIVNENDTVSVEEIRFGDNDTLASLVAHLIDAQLLVILSDVDGLYTSDPKRDASARRLHLVPAVTPEIERMAGASRSETGVGGMQTKLQAAKQAAAYGVATVIVQGHEPEVLERLFTGADTGTFFFPGPSRLKSRQQWIAYTRRCKGQLHLDHGAARAVGEQGRSLLPSGIVRVTGVFQRGDAVACLDPDGKEIARGLVNYSSGEVEKIQGCKTSELAQRLGYRLSDEVIHRDNLVVLKA